jgi:hypothetical protein
MALALAFTAVAHIPVEVMHSQQSALSLRSSGQSSDKELE